MSEDKITEHFDIHMLLIYRDWVIAATTEKEMTDWIEAFKVITIKFLSMVHLFDCRQLVVVMLV